MASRMGQCRVTVDFYMLCIATFQSPYIDTGLSRREECLIQQLRVGNCSLNYYTLFQILTNYDTGLCEVVKKMKQLNILFSIVQNTTKIDVS